MVKAHGQGGGWLLILIVLVGALRLGCGGCRVVLGLPCQAVIILLQLLLLLLLHILWLPDGQARALGGAIQVLDFRPEMTRRELTTDVLRQPLGSSGSGSPPCLMPPAPSDSSLPFSVTRLLELGF